MTNMDLHVDHSLLAHRIAQLAAHGAHGDTGVWRPVYSPEWVDAQDQVAAWGRDAGLDVTRDAVGNVWVTLPGSEPGPAIATGSHVDSQLPGGRFDGALGVIAAVLALETLKRACGTPRRTLTAVSLAEEEASRFPGANMWGSRSITGRATPADAEALVDADGVTLAAAMREAGLDPARIGEAVRDDLGAFLELHIEQGPLLEEADVPVGIVTGITGARHYVVELTGRADHAGARPQDDRRDALRGAADIVTRVNRAALEAGRPAVTTVGRLAVEPNLAAAVAERVTLTVDVRHPDPDALTELAAGVERIVQDAAVEHGLGLGVRRTFDLPPQPCDPALVALLEEAAGDVPHVSLHSGAAHDAQRMAAIGPAAMLFVRSQGGRSHTPEELSTIADCAAGIDVLTRALRGLAY